MPAPERPIIQDLRKQVDDAQRDNLFMEVEHQRILAQERGKTQAEFAKAQKYKQALEAIVLLKDSPLREGRNEAVRIAEEALL
jgi:regulator of protease activity HflC (stomatin/prohibitin superfamily)